MTASVDTHGMKGALFSAAEREKMYVGTLQFYLDTICRDPRQKIVFCDNSGWDLDSIRAKVGRRTDAIEWLSLAPDNFDVSRGKGCNELILMTQAAERSRLIRESGAFFKVTGRYPIYNLGYLVKRASKSIYKDGIKWYCDIKDHPIYDWCRLGWAGHDFDARLYGVERTFFLSRLAPLVLKVDDYPYESTLEAMFFDALKGDLCGEPIVDRFPREPRFGGRAGHRNGARNWTWSEDNDSLLERTKRLVGNMIRIFVPGLKF